MSSCFSETKQWNTDSLTIFICFSALAIHIELVSDLSTPKFLATLKRFVACSDTPAELASYCATNFKCASKVL